MKADILDLKGNSLKKIDLDEGVFGVETNPEISAMYVRVFRTNQRQGTSKVKNRSEVSGGGRKPWKQKHTGRSRQGSIRSPIWVHGGKAHGPQPKDWNLKLSSDLKKQAMSFALTEKAIGKKLFIFDKVEMEKPNTKALISLISGLKIEGKILIAWADRSWNLLKSAANIAGVDVAYAGNLNPYEVFQSDYLILEKGAVKILEERLKK